MSLFLVVGCVNQPDEENMAEEYVSADMMETVKTAAKAGWAASKMCEMCNDLKINDAINYAPIKDKCENKYKDFETWWAKSFSKAKQ